MELRISIITLGVADLERSWRFYPDGYLWEVAYGDGWEFHPDGSLVTK